MERNHEDVWKRTGEWPSQFGQSGVTQLPPARHLQPDIKSATQATATAQPQIMIAHDIGMEADVRTVRKEVEFLKKEMAEMKAILASLGAAAPVVELRDISYEDAKKEIKQYFEDHHGENLDAADLQEALGIDIQMAIQICNDLEQEGQIRGL